MNNVLTGKDLLLKPYFNLHFKHGLFKSIAKIYKNIFSKMNNSATEQKNIALRIIYVILSGLISFFIGLVFVPIYLAVYLLTVSVTFAVVSIVVMCLAVFYGLCPFAIKHDYIYEDDKEFKSEYKGLDRLLVPFSWSIHVNKNEIKNICEIGLVPGRKVAELNKNPAESSIIDRVSLVLSQIISFCVYVVVLYLSVTLLSDLFLIVITLICAIVWCVLKLFVDIVFKLFSSDDEKESDAKIKEENNDKGGKK